MKRLALVSAAFATVVGCSGSGDSAQESNDQAATVNENTAPPEWDRAVKRPASEAEADRARRACTFKRGAMPAETLGQELPVDRDVPIKTIVVLMQENRSFDHYFGRLAKFAKSIGVDMDVEAPQDDAANPEKVDDSASPAHAWHHAERLCQSDTNHEWFGAHIEFDNGKNDGFFQANQGFRENDQPEVGPELLSGERALSFYDERDIPFYYQLASTFAIGDHYHSSVIGPTWPNRDYLYAATSMGATTNVNPRCGGTANALCNQGEFDKKDVVIFDELTRRGIEWRFYIDGVEKAPRLGTFLTPHQLLTRYPKKKLLGVLPEATHFKGMDDFFDAAKSGTLPPVVFLDANIHEDAEGNDEHPPGDIQKGQKLTSDVVHALMASPQWKESALFFTYDENGGIFDHVPPPQACEPDDVAPDFRTKEDKDFDAKNPGSKFDHLGFRVPLVVVSPFVKKGFVSHHTYDHTSITRFIEAVFKVPALTSRDANADAMYDFFDFDAPPFTTPPTLPEATIDKARHDECVQLFTPPPPSESNDNNGG